jgi:hypothetical protein
MRSKAKNTRSATAAGSADPLVAIVGERISFRDAKRRVWQALDLLQSCHSRPQTEITLRTDLSQARRGRMP